MPSRKQLTSLLTVAMKARNCARAPYSHFKVGAAVLADSGEVYGGCNCETAAYTGTHAEQGAIAAAVCAGETKILAVLVVGPDGKTCPPCGLCRQALREFGTEIQVVLVDGNMFVTKTLAELLPESFAPDNLETVEAKMSA